MVLIIAYGNSLRRDDGSGFVMAEGIERILREKNISVKCICEHQLMPELSESIAEEGVSAVIFIDTRIADSEDVPAGVCLHPVGSHESSTPLGHHLDPSVLMHYARVLFGKTPPAWLLTIPGSDFEHGEGLSDTTSELIADFLISPDLYSLLVSEGILQEMAADTLSPNLRLPS